MKTKLAAIGFLVAALGLTSIAGVGRAADNNAPRPVIVELFTSQGCNSCPPADAFLGELAMRSDVLALAMHVDYWDYIGWKDPFAKRMYTDRQRSYSRSLARRFIYTPQMVVDGRLEDVGSDRLAINQLIARARAEQASLPQIVIVRADAGEGASEGASAVGAPHRLRIEAAKTGPVFRGAATVWLAIYDREHHTDVPRGENAGRRLVDYNIVREFRRLALFDGRPLTVPLDLGELASRHDAGVVFAQVDETGPILGAFAFTLKAPTRTSDTRY